MTHPFDEIEEIVSKETLDVTNMIEMKMTEKEFSDLKDLVDWLIDSDSFYEENIEFGKRICRVANAITRTEQS